MELSTGPDLIADPPPSRVDYPPTCFPPFDPPPQFPYNSRSFPAKTFGSVIPFILVRRALFAFAARRAEESDSRNARRNVAIIKIRRSDAL